MSSSSSEQSPLNALAEEFVERHRRGEHPALSEYTNRYPALADEIRELFPALVLIENIRPETGEATGPFQAGRMTADGRKLERLGDFRILGEVGRGGMGIVYEAEQESLGRHVALKILPAHSLLDSQRLLRFQREARAAARLHHTNIVPVFGVGEHEGLHFYVMQFIQGQGLDQVLTELRKLRQSKTGTVALSGDGGQDAGRRLHSEAVARALLTGRFAPAGAAGAPEEGEEVARPESSKGVVGDLPPGASSEVDVEPRPSKTQGVPLEGSSKVHLPGQSEQSALSESGREYWQSVARIGIQVAEALAYAHGQGTLHRDIKPSNLLLDTQGTVWVTDFGLAKAADSDDLTHTGDIVGTVRYMGPERFQGQADHRSDIYGLGLTLYELLTLRVAFEEADRNKLIHQVTHDEPPRPRKLNAAIPADLETVVLKAMSKEPSDRYQTAAELAEDLRRFVDDRPIRARRVSQAERLRRWCRRNPAVAGLLAAVAFLLLAGTALSTFFAVRAGQRAEEFRKQFYISNVNRALSEWQGNQVGLAERLLDECPEDLRGWEWHYGMRLCYLNPVTIHGYNAPNVDAYFFCALRSVAFSPDGQWIATADWDNTVKLWDTGTGQLVRPLRGDAGMVLSIAFSPDGKLLAAGGLDKVVRLWDPHTGEAVRTLQGHTAQVRCLAFHPDGKTLASVSHDAWDHSAADAEILVWGITTGKPLRRNVVSNPEGPLWVIVLSPDGQQFATGSASGTVQLGDTMTGNCDRTLKGHTLATVGDSAFSPDGMQVATGATDKTVRLWERTTGREVHVLRGHTGIVKSLAFSPDGTKLASTSEDNSVKLWDTRKGEEIATFRGHTGFVNSVAFSPDGSWLASAGQDGAVKLWNVRRVPEPLTRGQSSWVHRVVFSHDGQSLFSFSGFHRNPDGIRVWDVRSGRQTLAFGGAEGFLSSLTVSPDGTRLAAGGQQGVHLWDAQTGQKLHSFGATLGQVVSVDFSPDGRLLACTSGHQVHLLDSRTGQEQGAWNGGGGWFYVAVFSPDGKRLAALAEDQVLVWDLTNNQQSFSFPAGPEMKANPGGRDLSLAFSPDGKCLAAVDGGQITLREAATGRELFKLSGHSRAVSCLVFSPDGKRLAAGSWFDHDIKLWDTTTGQEVFTLRGHTAGVLSVAFSPDGHRLASGGRDHTVKVWDATPISPQRADQKKAYNLVGELFRESPRLNEVMEGLRADRTVTEPVREIALQFAQNRVEVLGSVAYQRRWAGNKDWANGLHLQAQREFEKAEQHYRERVQRHPERLRSHAELAEFLVLCPDPRFYDAARSRDALAHARKAAQLAPPTEDYRGLLGMACYRAGEWQAAVDALEKVVEEMPHRSRWFLAMAHWRLGNRDAARRWYAEAVAWTDKYKPGGVEQRNLRAEAAALLGGPETPKPKAATKQ